VNKHSHEQWNRMVILLLFLALPLASATIDLVSPEDHAYTNQANQSFEFHLGMDNVTSCTLIVDSTSAATITDLNKSGFKNISSTIGTGEHTWKIICNATNAQPDESDERIITLDLNEPNIVLWNPGNTENSSRMDSSTVDFSFVAIDTIAMNMSCELKVDNTTQATAIVQDSQPATITATGLTDGEHTWQVSCTDWATNAETSETRNFTVSATPPPPTFSITLQQAEMNIGESTLMTIAATNGTSIRVEACPNASGFVECKVPVIGNNILNYPFQEYLPFTNYAGRYILEAFFNKSGTTQTITLGYTVNNDIKVNIEGIDNPRKNNLIELEARATGGIGSLNYTWTLSNGNKVNNRKANITYSSAGTYTNTISVKDQYNNTMNKSMTLEVVNANRVIIAVKDKTNNAPIRYATVEIDDEQKETDTNGNAEYYLKPERKEVYILKENYTAFSGYINISGDQTFTILLDPIIRQIPKITMLRPANSSSISGITTDLVFKAEHTATLNCSVYINEKNDGFFIYLGSMIVDNGNEKVFGITELENKSYWWKVECKDSQHNTGMSESWQFNVGAAEQAQEQQPVVQATGYSAWIKEYEQVLNQFGTLSKEEKEAATALNIITQIEDTMQIFSDTIRDLDSLNFRKDLTNEQKQTEAEKLVAKADEAYQKGPVNLALLESDNYVDYIRKEELQSLAEEYMQMNNMSEDIDTEALIEYLDALQQEAVISTKIRAVRINYRDGTTKDMTAVIREIKVYNLTDGAFIIEIIPKEVAQDAADIKSTQEIEVLKQDPIIKFNLEGDTTLAYYFESSIPKEMLRQIKTAVLVNPSTISDDQLTGFAVKKFKLPAVKGIIYIPLIIVLLGGLVLVGFRYGGVDTAKYVLYRIRRNKNLHYISVILNEIHDNLSIGDVNKAVALYEEAKGAYHDLSDIAKNDIYEQVSDTASRINNYCQVMSMRSSVDGISVMITNIQGLLQGAEITAALEEYKKIESAFHSLDGEAQELLHPTLVQLGNSIQIAIENLKDNR